MGAMEVTREVLAAKFQAIFPHLDERQRRLLMGAEARAMGHGGIRAVARAAGVREATVSLGVDELDSGAEPLDRARKPGGGRKRAADLDPGLRPALLALVEPDERGDPMSPLRWTVKSTRNLATELTRQGHKVSADTVGDLLREEGFSLNWRGRPLTSHEVIVQTIAATTTRTGLRVHAEPGTSAYDTGVQVSDRQMDALPLTRRDWHGDWNYCLHPQEYDQASGAPHPLGLPSPDLAWLACPAITGLPACDWDALIATLLTLHDQQREANLDTRRGHRPRMTAPGTGRRPVLTLADRLLATILHQRLALPQVAIATLFSVRPETISKRIRDIRQLLDQAGYTIHPGPHRLASLDDLPRLAAAEGITIAPKIKTAC